MIPGDRLEYVIYSSEQISHLNRCMEFFQTETLGLFLASNAVVISCSYGNQLVKLCTFSNLGISCMIAYMCIIFFFLKKLMKLHHSFLCFAEHLSAMGDDRPFVCTAPGCGQVFLNAFTCMLI